MRLTQYLRYNNRFKQEYVYRLGGSTGFFSEYNNMLIAMLYCLVTQKRFALQSRNANFSSGAGWSTFFRSFIDEVYDSQLDKFNYRVKPLYQSQKERYLYNIYKCFHYRRHYMYEFFNLMREMDTDCIYEVKELNLKGNLRECCTELHRMIWHYNETTRMKIDSLITSLSLPDSYVGIHVRQGDKILENKLYQPSEYMDIIQIRTKIKDVFVLTDDYRTIENLRNNYSDYKFYTLCDESERGYYLPELEKRSQEYRDASMLRLWASMDVLEKGEFFVGTFSANPGMNMGFRLLDDKLTGLDVPHWILW